jgi:hypothetical protein
MTLVTDEKRICPVCGQAQADTDLETRANEQELHCQNKNCGFLASTEVRTDDNGRSYWVETTWFPMTEDGRVLRGSLDNRKDSPSAKVYALQTHEPLETRLDALSEPPVLYGSCAVAEIAATDYNNKFHDEEPATIVEIQVQESFQQELADGRVIDGDKHKPDERANDPYSPETLQRAYRMYEEGATPVAVMNATGLDRETSEWISTRQIAGLGIPADKPDTIVEAKLEDEL